MGGLILKLHRTDELAFNYVICRRRPMLDQAVRALTHLGGASLSVLGSILLMLAPDPAWHEAGVRGAFALIVSHLAVQLLKRSICRARPRLPVGAASLIEAPDRFSFPSGHAAAAMSVALPLAVIAPPMAGSWLIGLALAVGISRCYLGVHYPGDVVVGWLLAGLGFLAGRFLGL